jgi:hypothetical protein
MFYQTLKGVHGTKEIKKHYVRPTTKVKERDKILLINCQVNRREV